MAQFNIFINSKMNIGETEKLPIDEFDLLINMYKEYIKELEANK